MKQLINDDEFAKEVSEGLVLVDFMASWCRPCSMLSRELEQIDSIKIVKADIEELPITAYTYNVMGVPTLALFKNGEMIGRTAGFMPKEAIINWVESNS